MYLINYFCPFPAPKKTQEKATLNSTVTESHTHWLC